MAMKVRKPDLKPFDPTAGKEDKLISLYDLAKIVKKKTGYKMLPKRMRVPLPNYFGARMVDPRKIFVSYKNGQRWLEPKEILKLLKKWDPNCVTAIDVCYNEELDEYYVSDGQHHGVAALMYYGFDTELPLTGIISNDPLVCLARQQAVNSGSVPMKPYHSFMASVTLKDPTAMAIMSTLSNAGITLSRGSLKAGEWGHMGDLTKAVAYGLGPLEFVGKRYRKYWPNDAIHTATILGLLEVRKRLVKEKTYSAKLFDEVMQVCVDNFESPSELHKNCKAIFKATKTDGDSTIAEQVASGIISVFNKRKRKTLCEAPFKISMPVMPQKLIKKRYYPKYNPKTYYSIHVFAEICKTGDLSLAWAHKMAGRKGKVTADHLHSVCRKICPITRLVLDYGIGDNCGNKSADNRPSVDKFIPKLGYVNGNVGVISTRANTVKNDLTNSAHDKRVLVNVQKYIEKVTRAAKAAPVNAYQSSP